MKNKKIKDMIVVGFALFAIFFGAGNLIFPPYLGFQAGTNWTTVMAGFLLTDPVIPIITLLVTIFAGGKAVDLGRRVNYPFAVILAGAAMISVGPVFAIPRTAATTYEVGVLPFLPEAPIWVVSAIFFAITLRLAIKKTGVIDIIGQYITPILLVFLGLIIVKAMVSPVGAIMPVEGSDFFTTGLKEGYQTMDAMVALLCTSIVTGDLLRKGYGDASKKDKTQMIVAVSVLALVLIILVYSGLAYVGAQGGAHFPASASRVDILTGMVGMVLGKWGRVALGIAVSLACLTTSVGLTSAAGDFFESVSNNKWKYEYVVCVSVVVSFIFSLVGVEGIISLAGPVLDVVYPALIAMSLIMIFDRKIKYDATIIGMATGTLVAAFITTIFNLTGFLEGAAGIVDSMPLAEFGFSWLVPGLIGALIGTILGYKGIGKTRDDHDIKPAL
ncbi:MAG: branched-chain amino acid transport system II carrier protein [Peptoniphilus sp.]|nr:branched-chain amino acid transport system II carrier protein [Peptoniphilus sp.]MDD7363510.1 branched-chain amino acid transport system II carrier protein [Bacillota bacterium]MDY6044787.1 branched-chain amino acid transport system II carrier protein [Peptoniphilus sp.]